MHIRVIARADVKTGTLSYKIGNDEDTEIKCAIGKAGACEAKSAKVEGDGQTPTGMFSLRRLWYRADRLTLPDCGMTCKIIDENAGWSDDPDDPNYNKPIRMPHPFRHESLWREDSLYDVIIEIGYNDVTPKPGLGSAIFLHIEKNNYQPTLGCVAISREDMLDLIPHLTPTSTIAITLKS